MAQHQLKTLLFSGGGTNHGTANRRRQAEASQGEASPQQATIRWVLKNCAVASMPSRNALDSSRSSIPDRSDAFVLAACGWLKCRAITPRIPTHNATDTVGIALTPQAPGLCGIRHLNRFGVQLALALKNQVLKRRHHNRRHASLFSNRSMN